MDGSFAQETRPLPRRLLRRHYLIIRLIFPCSLQTPDATVFPKTVLRHVLPETIFGSTTTARSRSTTYVPALSFSACSAASSAVPTYMNACSG
ncbi:MAG: hypothetical protein KGY81_08235, partial [Phycisphaerae bacterium]|nr:hypothetical protein [Phycisphaerae bacterium]